MRLYGSVLLLALVLSGVTAAQTASPWPEADKLFHSDRQWLGSDAAFSIDLGEGRVLWMFGDTFVGRKPSDTRRNASFVRNTVAIQTGYDPARATIKFYWRTVAGRPSEIFPSEGKIWMWPSSGIRIGGRLLLFCTRVAATRDKKFLGFQLAGWSAFAVDNPDSE